MKSRMLDDVTACASFTPASRSGMSTLSAPIFSSARFCMSPSALQTTCGTPSSLRFIVMTMLAARSVPMATIAQS